MKTAVIVVHPHLEDGSKVNRRLKEAAEAAGGLTVHDLYAAYPDGAIDTAREQQLLSGHDRVIFQFPFWWYASPALLKSWFDDVLAFGWAYGPGGDKLHGKEWGFAITTGSDAAAYGPEGYNRFTMEEMTRPYQSICNLIGVRQMPSFIVHNAAGLTGDELDHTAAMYVDYLTAAHTRA